MLSPRRGQAYNCTNKGTAMIHVCSLAALPTPSKPPEPVTSSPSWPSRSGAAAGIGAAGQSPENIDGRYYRADGWLCRAFGFAYRAGPEFRARLGPQRPARGPLFTPASAARPQVLFAAVCMLNPHRDEISIARQIRAASPIASPNRLIVEPGGPGVGARRSDAARARRNGPGQYDDRRPAFCLDLD